MYVSTKQGHSMPIRPDNVIMGHGSKQVKKTQNKEKITLNIFKKVTNTSKNQ
jgi:hypothetical protein